MFGFSTELTEVRNELKITHDALADNDHKYKNYLMDLEAEHVRSLSRKDDSIKSLQNHIARIEAEMEARLKLQGEILKEEFDAKKNNLDLQAEAKAQKLIAQAEIDGTKIIQQALDNVQVVYKNTLDVLTEKIANLTEIDVSDITGLIRAATEGYPAFPDSISSTSSSK